MLAGDELATEEIFDCFLQFYQKENSRFFFDWAEKVLKEDPLKGQFSMNSNSSTPPGMQGRNKQKKTRRELVLERICRNSQRLVRSSDKDIVEPQPSEGPLCGMS